MPSPAVRQCDARANLTRVGARRGGGPWRRRNPANAPRRECARKLDVRGRAATIGAMSSPRAKLLALALAAAGCAARGRVARDDALPPASAQSRIGPREPVAAPAPASARRVQARGPSRDVAVRRAIDAAQRLVGRREIVVSGVRYGDGCVALVRAAFAEAGAPLPASAADAPSLLALARERGAVRRSRPAAGDLVFLADRPGGPAEHVGLVASVADDGTALVLHHTERGVVRLHLNAGQPWKARTEAGKAVNDVLLVGAGRITAGRLLVGWATLL
jgi:cell wall-associated NlpC family hydrolase